MKIRIWAGVCLLAFLISGCGGSDSYFDKAKSDTQQVWDTAESTQTVLQEKDGQNEECYVHVCGAVAQPGVYKLPAKSRIYEAVEMAGGLLETACFDSVNQAEEITDGQMVKIPTQEEAAQPNVQDAGGTEDGRINLNTADETQLMELPGIGASKAKSILSYRAEQGGFSSIEEIKNITGIKEGVYSKIRDYITVN